MPGEKRGRSDGQSQQQHENKFRVKGKISEKQWEGAGVDTVYAIYKNRNVCYSIEMVYESFSVSKQKEMEFNNNNALRFNKSYFTL